MLCSPLVRRCTPLYKRLTSATTSAPKRPFHDETSQTHPPASAPLPRRQQSAYKSLCKLTLIGRTGITPQLKWNHDGSQTLYLSVATSHASSGELGERRLQTQWHSVFVSESTPGFSFFHALPVGTHVYVEGLMNVRTVQRDGHTRQFVNVNVSQGFGMVRVLSSPRGTDDEQDGVSDDGKVPF